MFQAKQDEHYLWFAELIVLDKPGHQSPSCPAKITKGRPKMLGLPSLVQVTLGIQRGETPASVAEFFLV